MSLSTKAETTAETGAETGRAQTVAKGAPPAQTPARTDAPGIGALGTAQTPPDTVRPALGPVERAVAVGLIAAFVLFIVALVALRGDRNWDRLVYLFTGLEALVFAAAGAFFGTSVQRAQTEQVRQVAERERTRADANEQGALRGAALAELIRAKVGRPPAPPDGPAPQDEESGVVRAARPGMYPGAGRLGQPPAPGAAGGPPAPGAVAGGDLTELAALVDRWFPGDSR